MKDQYRSITLGALCDLYRATYVVAADVAVKGGSLDRAGGRLTFARQAAKDAVDDVIGAQLALEDATATPQGESPSAAERGQGGGDDA